jgi:hypothetical protein
VNQEERTRDAIKQIEAGVRKLYRFGDNSIKDVADILDSIHDRIATEIEEPEG